MPDSRTEWRLRLPGGKHLRITAGGVLIGRSPECEVVLTDAHASRAQAIIYAGGRAPRLVVLGKGVTAVNGVAVEHDCELADRDRLTLPGLALEIEAEHATPAATATPTTTWVLESSSSGLFGISRTPFGVGGEASSDLCIDGWPAAVMRFHASELLLVEAIEPIALDGVDVEPGELEPVRAGVVISYRGERMTVVAGGPLREVSTVSESREDGGELPRRVRVDFLPRGGRVTVAVAGREVSVYLADRRCDLIAALLQPPAPYVAGDFVPDDLMIPRIWSTQVKTRVDLNVLVHRVRRDLAKVELDGAALVPRAPGGNATRFTLAPGADVSLA